MEVWRRSKWGLVVLVAVALLVGSILGPGMSSVYPWSGRQRLASSASG